MAEELVLELFSEQSGDEVTVAAPNILTKITKLQQITSGFVKDSDGAIHNLTSPKSSAATELLESIGGSEHVLVWTKYTHEIDIVRKILASPDTNFKRKIWELSGRISDQNRAIAIKEFCDRSVPSVMICNLKIGSVGLNFAHVAHVIYYSRNYSFVDSSQSEDRTHRIGQDRKCTYYDLVVKDTVDVSIIKALKKKHDLAAIMSRVDVRSLFAGKL